MWVRVSETYNKNARNKTRTQYFELEILHETLEKLRCRQEGKTRIPRFTKEILSLKPVSTVKIFI